MKSNEQLIEILRMWNYWDEDSTIDLFSRDLYEKNIKNLRETKEVIVLKGVRRSGKSSLMYLEIQNLIQNGVKRENILFVNFEEPQFMNELDVSLLDAIYEAYLEVLEPRGKLYIFLDEVQNIYGWEKWVLRMYEKTNVQLYVSGSSSKLLSSEFSTALSGRHLSIEVYPLSFKEFLAFKNINTKSKKNIVFNKSLIKKGFKGYLSWGGFPKVLEIESELYKKNELISYYDTIILKDIAKRYEISNISELRELSFYLLSNVAKLYSINALKKLQLGAYDTLKKYVEFFKESYLLFELNKYDPSVKKQLVNQKKIYCIDPGFANAVAFRFSQDQGRLLENIVFLELRRRGLEVFYHKDRKECDFIIKEGLSITTAIQVSVSLQDESTKEREIEGVLDACKHHNLEKGFILTQDEEDSFTQDGIEIIVLPVWKWILE